MSKPSNELSGWEPCPPGELVRFVQSDKWKRRKAVVARATSLLLGGTLSLSLIVWSAYRFATLADSDRTASLTCREVQSQLSAYVLGRLDEQQRRRIEGHLEHCPRCRKRLQEIQHSAERGSTNVIRRTGRDYVSNAAPRRQLALVPALLPFLRGLSLLKLHCCVDRISDAALRHGVSRADAGRHKMQPVEIGRTRLAARYCCGAP